MKLVALIPAHNEAGSIGATIEAALNQERPADEIVVIPNGCTDNTAEIARQYPVTVLELLRLEHRKSEALNRGWLAYAQDADVVVCIDADTVLPPNAFSSWAREMTDPRIGGSSSKFTAQGTGFLGRCQKSEYAAWADKCLDMGETRVVSGTGAALSGEALRLIASRDDRPGPWSYRSATEDFELTYRLRELGYVCHVSPSVRAYTDTMPTLRALWGQRMKWASGTIEDLISFGLNRLTWRDWGVQLAGWLHVLVLLLTAVLVGLYATLGGFTLVWYWLALPALVSALEVKRSYRIPHRHLKDTLLAASLLPVMFYALFRAALTVRSWADLVYQRITNTTIDRWGAQALAEGE